MTSNAGHKSFDCVKWTRETRDRLSRKMATMTWEEIEQWLNEGARKDPLFSQFRKAPIHPPRRDPEPSEGKRIPRAR